MSLEAGQRPLFPGYTIVSNSTFQIDLTLSQSASTDSEKLILQLTRFSCQKVCVMSVCFC